MLVQEKSLPKPNIYSSKILFEQIDERNKKRMAQMQKRKTALSTKNHSLKNNFDDLSLKESPISQKNEDNANNLIFINIIREKEININNIINPSYNNNEIFIDIKTTNEPEREREQKEKKDEEKEKETEEKEIVTNNNINNKIKAGNCSAVSNNIVNENNNYNNTSSTNNSINNSILYKDSQEKEINISNLDNDSIDDIIINNEDNNNNIRGSNLYDYDKDDDNILTKEEHRLKEENEFALKYLSSSSDSFVQLDNNLVARAKAQGSDMTDSYLQALFPQLPLDNKSLKNKTYEVTEIIKEEKEIETPLRRKNNNSRNSKDFSRGSIDINFNLSNDNSQNSIIRFLKKSPNKNSTSNFSKFNQNKNKNKDNIKKNNVNIISNKSNFSLDLRGPTIIMRKNNTMSIFTKNLTNSKKSQKTKNLNKTSSFSNINNNNFIKKKNKSNYSTFCSNLHKNKTEYRLNKNIIKKINLKQSLNNLNNNKNENDLNDSLISDYIKNIDKPKNIKKTKINMHYIKNINNYQKYKNLNKNIIKRNHDKYKLYNETTNDLSSLNRSKKNFFINDKNYNSIDITKKRSIVSSRNISKKYLNNKSFKINYINNYKDNSINFNKETYQKFINANINHSKTKIKKKINHHQTSSLLYSTNASLKINQKLKKNLSKYTRVQSLSKLSSGKNIKNSLYDSSTSTNQYKRSKTHKKLIKTNKNINNESIILNTSYNRNNNNKNININNNNLSFKKCKFTTFYKKIDYSYVKPKVETGLSEIMLKKLLNNNKKLTKKQTNKKIETEKKQSIIKTCKITMNKTIDNIKEIATNIKKKLFKVGNNEKNNNNDDKNVSSIHSYRNTKK